MFNRFEFRVFLLLDWLQYQDWRDLPYYLPIAGGIKICFNPPLRVLVLYGMQTVPPRNWTRVAVFISYDAIDYTTNVIPIYKCTFDNCFYLMLMNFSKCLLSGSEYFALEYYTNTSDVITYQALSMSSALKLWNQKLNVKIEDSNWMKRLFW